MTQSEEAKAVDAGPNNSPSDAVTALAPAAATGTDDALLREYYALLDVVRDFDKNMLTVNGWGATVSLVALGAYGGNGCSGSHCMSRCLTSLPS